MDHPKDKGDRTTLAVIMALRECGYDVLVPFGENTRYDLAIHDGESFSRVQCKTGRLRNGAVLFAVCSCYGHHMRPGEARRDYRGQIEYFGVHCLETERVYLVPIEDLDVRTTAALRVDPARNAQRLRTRPAADYEVGRVTVSPVIKAGV